MMNKMATLVSFLAVGVAAGTASADTTLTRHVDRLPATPAIERDADIVSDAPASPRARSLGELQAVRLGFAVGTNAFPSRAASLGETHRAVLNLEYPVSDGLTGPTFTRPVIQLASAGGESPVSMSSAIGDLGAAIP
jgi:hypothetical protein